MDKEFSFDLKEDQSEDLAKIFMLDELDKIHKRFENGTETIDDIINHCTNYIIGFSDRPELNVVEKKHFDRLVNYVKELQQEKELNQAAINIANNQLCNYELGYQDGLHKNITATQMVIENKKNFMIQQQIKSLKDRIYELHKKIDEGNERVQQEYISKDKIREILDKHKETPLELGWEFYNDIQKLLEV